MTVAVVDAVADGSVDDRLSGIPRSLSDFQPSLKTRNCFRSSWLRLMLLLLCTSFCSFCLKVVLTVLFSFRWLVREFRLTRDNRYDNRDSFTHFELGLLKSST